MLGDPPQIGNSSSSCVAHSAGELRLCLGGRPCPIAFVDVVAIALGILRSMFRKVRPSPIVIRSHARVGREATVRTVRFVRVGKPDPAKCLAVKR
jgi:hypothetical protein